MENCPTSETLLQWLNRSVDSESVDGIDSHIRQCNHCQNRLDELTDEASVKPEFAHEMNDSLQFTGEPDYKDLRLGLSQKLVELRTELQDEKLNVGSPIQRPRDETVKALDSTLKGDDSDSPRAQSISTELKQAFSEQGYEVEGMIGRGGFASVYQAWEKRLERTVAIKLLDEHRINSRNRHRFLREAKTASSIDSANVVKVITCGEMNERPYIVLELVSGTTIGEWLSQRSQDSISQETISNAAGLLVQVCGGVQSVHDAGLVHRDIKPSNLFVDAKSQIAKLGDFGLARILNDDTVTLTRAAELVGTPAYMSPEQTAPSGDVTQASDVYSIGATLYHILTGRPPFQGSSIAILNQINEVQPTPPTQLNEYVSRDFETICLKALEKEPSRRYASPRHLAEDLTRALNGEPIEARPLSNLQRTIRWMTANRSLATTLGLLFVSLLAGTIASSVMWYRASMAERQASKAEQQAVEDREAILGSMNHLVATVFEDLGNNAATIKARESVLQAAIDGLDSITKVGGNTQADYTRMIAYRRLGNMMNFKKDDEAAKDYFVQAVELARKRREQKKSKQTAIDLADSLNDLTYHYELFQKESEDREQLAAESKTLLDEILAETPNDPDALYLSLRNDTIRFRALVMRAEDSATKTLAEAPLVLEKVVRLLKHPQKTHYPEDVCREIQFQIGRAYFLQKDFDTASVHFEKSRTHLENAMAREPNNLKLIEHESALNAIDAMIASENGNFERAVELAKTTVEAVRKLAADDLENAARQQQLANSYTALTNSLIGIQKYEEAIAIQDKSFAIYKELLAKSPNDRVIRMSLAIDLFTYRVPAELLQHKWKDAKKTYQLFRHYIQAPKFGDPIVGTQVDANMAQAASQIEVLKLLTGDDDAIRNSDNECMALIYIARKDADESGEDQLTNESLKVMHAINPEIEANTLPELFEHIRSLEGLSKTLKVYADQTETYCLDVKTRNKNAAKPFGL